MSKPTCPCCGHDTTNDRKLYIRDLTNGTRVMGGNISEFLSAYEENPGSFTRRMCMELYTDIMKVLPLYNRSFARLNHSHYLHMSDVANSDKHRYLTEEEFEAKRDQTTVKIGEFVEPMWKLESDMEDAIRCDDYKKWQDAERSQHKMFNTFTMVLTTILFRRV